MSGGDWKTHVRNQLKQKLDDCGITYRELARRMTELGAVETEVTVKKKIGRGTFSAVFLVQALIAIGHPSLDVTMPPGAE